ncbi:MAG: radical SAM protein [Actinomycetota bacterium]
MELTPSRYNVHVPLREDRALVHNTATGVLALLDPDELAVLDSPRGSTSAAGVMGDLVASGLVVPGGFDEQAALRDDYERSRFDPSALMLTIAPTMACNFACDYCFQGADKPSGPMSPEIEDAVVGSIGDRLRDGSIRRLGVAWYGGEPLLALSVIERLSTRIMELCERHDVQYSAMMVSNGYRLDADVARTLLSKHVTTVQVTLDGGPEHHDQRRVLHSGAPTFDRIVERLKAAADAGLHISVRVNIDRRNADGVPDLISSLVARGLARHRKLGVYFAPVEAITEQCHSIESECYSKAEYGTLEAKFNRLAFSAGLRSVPYPPRFRGICGAVRPNGFVVLANGELHKCWDTVADSSHAVGHITNEGALGDNARAQHWLEWTPFDEKGCQDCTLLPTCAGACAHKFVNPPATAGEAATSPCPSWKYNIVEQLAFKALEAGTITMDDVDPELLVTDVDKLGGEHPLLEGRDRQPRWQPVELRTKATSAPLVAAGALHGEGVS